MLSFLSGIILRGLLLNVFNKLKIFCVIEFVGRVGDCIIFMILGLFIDLYCLLSRRNLFIYGCNNLFKSVFFG